MSFFFLYYHKNAILSTCHFGSGVGNSMSNCLHETTYTSDSRIADQTYDSFGYIRYKACSSAQHVRGEDDDSKLTFERLQTQFCKFSVQSGFAKFIKCV